MGIYVFHQGSDGNNLQLWYSTYNGSTWFQDTQVQNLALWDPPAAVGWASGISVFHQGWNGEVGPDGNIWCNYTSDGANWGKDTPLPAAQQGIFGRPSPVVYSGNGCLYVFYLYGPSTAGDPGFPDPGTCVPPPEALRRSAFGLPPNLQQSAARQSALRQADLLYYALTYSYFDGSTWYGPYQIPNVGVISAVGSAVNWAGGITVFYQGVDSNYNPDGSLWFVYSADGVNWGGATPVQNVGLSVYPSAVVYNNNLYVFHQGYGNNGQLWYSVFDGANWAPDTLVTTLAMSGAPSAVLWDGITVFHQGGGNDETLRFVSSPNGVNWGGDTQVPNVALSNSPSALVA